MIKKLILGFFISITIFSCGKKDSPKLIDNSGKEIIIKINRFEDILFDSNQRDLRSHLKENFQNYRPLFNTTLEDDKYFEEIRDFASDTIMISIYNKIKTNYPNLDWLEKDISSGFARLKTYYPNIDIPKFYTLILGPYEFSMAYSSRIIARKEFISIAIDLYSINSFEDNYYSHFPKYIQKILDSNYIAPDIFYNYLRDVLTLETPLIENKPMPSLIEIMIERGKYLYTISNLLPEYKLKDLLRYNEEEILWAEKNEINIWGYLSQNRLLFEKDRNKYISFISEGPSTKGIQGSPSRLGEYIGYKIVESYVSKNNINIKELLEINDMEKILKESSYKPKKR